MPVVRWSRTKLSVIVIEIGVECRREWQLLLIENGKQALPGRRLTYRLYPPRRRRRRRQSLLFTFFSSLPFENETIRLPACNPAGGDLGFSEFSGVDPSSNDGRSGSVRSSHQTVSGASRN